MKKCLFIGLFILFQTCMMFGQDIIGVLNSKVSVKVKCEQLEEIADSNLSKNIDSLVYVCDLMDSISKTTSDAELISHTLHFYSSKLIKRKNELALEKAYENLELSKNSKNCKLLSTAYSLIAGVQYWGIGNIEKGFEFYEAAMDEAEKCKDKETLLQVYKQSQDIYFNNQQYEKNKQILLKMERVEPKLKYDAWHNAAFGDLFRNMEILDSADHYYFLAFKHAEDKRDSASLMSLYSNYTLIPLSRKNYKMAIFYAKKSLQIAENLNLKFVSGYLQLSNVYNELGDLESARKYLQKAIEIQEEQNCIPCLISRYKVMSELLFEQKDYKGAYIYLLKNNELFSSQHNAQSSADLNKVEEDNLKNQKQLEMDLINEQKRSETRLKNISFIALGFALLLICGIIVSLYKINKSKKTISLQKTEVERQKHLVEEKHQEITDSINYAERIQRSFLATKEQLDVQLKDYFVLFQPKDVVSGDFYWAHTLHNGNFALVTADSTGHGVPGAIMSLLNTSSLEKAVELGISEPAEILNHTRQTIIQRLKKDGSTEGGKDGMDCSLISLNKEKTKLTYAAANNPVWIIRNNELIELSPDKIPVGKHDRDTVSFTQHEVELQKGDMIYTLTDGFPDQFGGPKGKKFMYKKLKEMLGSIAHKPTTEQQTVLKNTLKDWMGNTEQVDDVTIIGIRV